MTSDPGASSIPIAAEPLAPEAFAPFGQVLGPGIGESRLIRDGDVRLTRVPPCLDHAEAAFRADVDIYEVGGVAAPVACARIERHPLSAQLFMPQTGAAGTDARWLVVVWPEGPDGPVRAFVADGGQGVVYGRGVWHMGIVALGADQRFLSVMFRGAGTRDTEFHALSRPVAIEVAAV